jgi:hypothetical protein
VAEPVTVMVVEAVSEAVILVAVVAVVATTEVAVEV